MKLSFINEGIFEPYKSPVERKNSLIYSIDRLVSEHTLMGGLRGSSIFLDKG